MCELAISFISVSSVSDRIYLICIEQNLAYTRKLLPSTVIVPYIMARFRNTFDTFERIKNRDTPFRTVSAVCVTQHTHTHTRAQKFKT